MSANIQYFEKCVQEAIDFLGLHSFRFVITSQKKPGTKASNYYHSISDTDGSPRVFTICYSEPWINEVTSLEEIRITAFHEVFESMFYRLRDFSLNTTEEVLPREVDDQIHSIVRTFENRILPLIKEPPNNQIRS